VAKFRFRAQAALDLRHREYEESQRKLAQAERDRSVAQARLHRAGEAVIAAQRAAADAQAKAAADHQLDWYRFWIERLAHERQAHALVVKAREQRVAEAAAACQRAHQRCEALERFREKAKRAHEAAESATERKLIDELATQRYAAASRVTADLQARLRKEESNP
jgi:flagellar export protein FliJ